ncbi:adaptor protein MecA [Bacillus massiliglaciei]|uniref:adaptor protein MecA n=1 Tax=Bacillus massiliglaciei TaxID=1816693 RepID=UPI000ACD129F|nr:adaptor protein MecA [Bacillus massiliglaciei]
MKLERITHNKIKIFLTLDDLLDKGITKEDILGNSLKVHKLFQDMIEEACEELDFEITGTVAIEIFSLPAQGLVIIVTKEEELWTEDEDEYIDFQVKIDKYDHSLYVFEDFEDIIQLSKLFLSCTAGSMESSLYVNEGRYYLLLENIEEENFEDILSMASEYGCSSTLSIHFLYEYGKEIICSNAIQVVASQFK